MPKIIIEIDDSLLSKALIESQDQQISLDTFINDSLATVLLEPNPITRRSISVDEILQSAVEHAKELEIGLEFLLVDICTEENWAALNSGERKKLGKDFRKEVEGATPAIARHIGRTSSNKAKYQRI